MKLILTAMEPNLADAWAKEFRGVANVQIHRGSIFDVEADALVSPANSYGFMDGGIDAQYSRVFGWDLQLRLRRVIVDHHYGELLVGAAEIVSTGNHNHPYLIAAPTMRVPMVLDQNTVNPFLATRATLLLVRHGTFHTEALSGAKVREHVRTIAFPGMGTGVGRVPAARCARQMRAAFDQARQESIVLPSSWAEASEEHQLLYTDRPRGLQ
ncbi:MULTISPECIES: macro domain-containing protein [unclassified Mesorhizobium]|uniref:macro domain-containing protein n=1 Tax=unclassified Mesorhizobium TaxID=325217 RepID=UPI001128FA4D|nr:MULTISPECIES: macro domain-containing protein [unclassified Mesorhizobium]TPL11637.1 Appr-1-p processing protein [Mesorhizobium sp. B2-4-14]UCI31212.1 macro domain-containing protein [Mesorhizobium sp. B4-1-4]